MNSRHNPGDEILFPVTVSLKVETVLLLSEMAEDMGLSIDDVLSILAEDAAIDLEINNSLPNEINIPDKCSKEDLMKVIE